MRAMVPTPGHITRLKLIKRSLYGRAHFDLLRLRVLSPSQKIQGAKGKGDRKRRRGRPRRLSGGEISPNFRHEPFADTQVHKHLEIPQTRKGGGFAPFPSGP